MGINHSTRWLQRGMKGVLTALAVGTALFLLSSPVHAQQSAGEDFNVQVSPSPLVVVLKPGERKTATITVRNLSNHNETLYPALKGFDIDSSSQKITIKDSLPANLEDWISFKQSALTLAAGASQPLEVAYETPKNVGFSYSVAITLNRAPNAANPGSVRLEGGIAVFNLININRPDAVSKLSIEAFSSKKSVYEFLPASFTITVKNEGNIIGQPTGTVFIQRSFDSEEPIATLPLNKADSYVLPGTARPLTVTWEDGFPRYVTKTEAANAEPVTKLTWNWSGANHLRFGRYVAKVVLVYNDGQRDVPVTFSKTFWVIPWRLIAGLVLLLALVIVGIVASGWLGFKAAKKVKHKVKRHEK